MPALDMQPLRRRSLTWLLWLALLLPVAQVAMAAHAVGHDLAQGAGQVDGRQALHLSEHCDLCLMAASLSGSAPAPDVAGFVAEPGRAASPAGRPISAWTPPTLTVYSSRAPPRSSR